MVESQEDQMTNENTTTIDNNDLGMSPQRSANGEANEDAFQHAPSTTNTTSTQWQANNFENDYQLLKIAMTRQSAVTDLQQQQRKYTLDHGFARNRRPLVTDLLQTIVKIGGWMLFLSGGGAGDGFDGVIRSWNQSQLWRRKLHILATQSIVTLSTLHHWIVGMALPMFLLALVKYEKLGPSGRTLDEYFTSRGKSSSDAPSFFYTTDKSKKKAKDKDTGNFVLCLLENWSSAVVVMFIWEMYSMLASLRKPWLIASNTNVCTRLLTRAGAAAAIHQYPSLLFELRRDDQPRPLSRPTAYLQHAVKMLLGWLPLGVASDLAVMYGIRKGGFGTASLGTVVASCFSVIAPLCHFVALRRIARVSKCSAVSLSGATSFPINDERAIEGDVAFDSQKVKWRYQLRWRTPQRIGETLRSWSNYFFTGHDALLFEMDDWKKQPLSFDDFSTEGTRYLSRKDRKLSDEENKTTNSKIDNDDLTFHADDIVESLSLIFRDRDAAINNATQARLIKHQESYNTKTLDDILGVAVQQTFGIGLSYDFDHFDSPADGEEVSIHQLRARMAKSAIRRKKELDGAMKTELGVLRKLKENVVTAANKEEAEKEMKSVEQDIRERHGSKVDRMRNALLTLIPTNTDMPKGSEQYDSPIMVAEYVNLNAPVDRRGELKATIASAPDPLTMIEDYVRKDFGDEAAGAWRRDEIEARKKEKEMLSKFRERYGELKDEEVSQSEPALADTDGVGESIDSASGDSE